MTYGLRTVDSICTIFDRLRKPISKSNRKAGIYPYYGASCIQDYVADYLFDGRYLLIGEDGAKWESGDETAYIVEGKFWVNNHAHILKVNEDIVDSYVKYYFTFLDLTEYVTGAIIPKLTQETLRNITIPIPSFSEQQRIVDVLDKEFAKIDELKSNAEQNLQNAKDLFQAALNTGLTEGATLPVSMNDLCEITSSLVDPCESQYQNLLHVGGGNIESDTGVLFDLKTAKEEKLVSGKFLFDNSMVLYNKIRPYLKKVARPDFCGLCSADMYPLKPKSTCNKDYLYYLLLSKQFTDYAIMGSARAGMPKVNRDHLFAFTCKVPKFEQQVKIATTLDDLNAKCKVFQDNYTKTISLCDDLKQSLLRKAFNGEL